MAFSKPVMWCWLRGSTLSSRTGFWIFRERARLRFDSVRYDCQIRSPMEPTGRANERPMTAVRTPDIAALHPGYEFRTSREFERSLVGLHHAVAAATLGGVKRLVGNPHHFCKLDVTEADGKADADRHALASFTDRDFFCRTGLANFLGILLGLIAANSNHQRREFLAAISCHQHAVFPRE